MVLDLKLPHAATLGALREVAPTFVSYVLSFVYVAIYWNNHHHFFHLVPRVNGAILWANLHLLFWLGRNHAAAVPTALYGVTLLMSATAWYILQLAIIRAQGPNSALSKAIGPDIKGKISPVLYAAGIFLAFFDTVISDALYALVALLWLIPDRRVESTVDHR